MVSYRPIGCAPPPLGWPVLFFNPSKYSIDIYLLHKAAMDDDENRRNMGEEVETVELPIDGILDLHAFDPKDVKDLVPDYIAACRERDIVDLRIIHGKGSGALRRTVHALLDRHTQVVSYRLADPGSGSWGATIVEITPLGESEK